MREEPYKDFAAAIVAQAAKDYRAALCELKRDPYSWKAWNMKKDAEKFFRSDWMVELTGLDGRLLIRKIREDVKYI